MRLLRLVMLLAAPGLVHAQSGPNRDLLADFQRNRDVVLAYIDAMPDSATDYRPTPGVRTFAGQFDHIVSTNLEVAAVALRGLKSPPALGDSAVYLHNKAALHRYAADIRRTAEDNAHAFKTPIAVIRQSIEPLRRALPEDNQRAQRAIGVVEHSLDRLDGLVASARRLDEATADLLAKPRVPVDLGRVIGGLIQIQSALLANRDLTIILASHDLMITADLLPGLFVLGTEEMIETVLENLN